MMFYISTHLGLDGIHAGRAGSLAPGRVACTVPTVAFLECLDEQGFIGDVVFVKLVTAGLDIVAAWRDWSLPRLSAAVVTRMI